MTITRILVDGAKSLWAGYKIISVSSQYISERATVVLKVLTIVQSC